MKNLIVALGIVLLPNFVRADDTEGFVSLFDGKTLQGWEGDKKWFRVEGNAIVAGTTNSRIPRNEFLSTTKQYGDFELRLMVKTIGKGANAGIQIRSQRIPNNHEMIGYQADVGEGWWGKLYDESRRRRILAGRDDAQSFAKANDWNEYVIRCQGHRVQFWLNGTKTVDYVEKDESVEPNGLIALQIHSGPPTEAWYKDIRIKQL